MLSWFCVLPISFFSQYVQNWSISSVHPVWSTGQPPAKLCHNLLKSIWKSFCWLHCVWVWFNFPLSLWEQWPCLHCSTKCLPVSPCHPHPQPCPSLPHSVFQHWRGDHKTQQNPCFVLPPALLSRDTIRTHGLTRMVLGWLFSCHSTLPCAPLYVYVVLSFLLHWEYKNWGMDSRERLRKKNISWRDLFFILSFQGRVFSERKIKSRSLNWNLTNCPVLIKIRKEQAPESLPNLSSASVWFDASRVLLLTHEQQLLRLCAPMAGNWVWCTLLVGSCWDSFTPPLQHAQVLCSAARMANQHVSAKESGPGWLCKSIGEIWG